MPINRHLIRFVIISYFIQTFVIFFICLVVFCYTCSTTLVICTFYQIWKCKKQIYWNLYILGIWNHTYICTAYNVLNSLYVAQWTFTWLIVLYKNPLDNNNHNIYYCNSLYRISVFMWIIHCTHSYLKSTFI